MSETEATANPTNEDAAPEAAPNRPAFEATTIPPEELDRLTDGHRGGAEDRLRPRNPGRHL